MNAPTTVPTPPAPEPPRPFVVGIGGAFRHGSSTERALRKSLDAAEEDGAETLLLSASDLVLPMYDPAQPERTTGAYRLLEAVGRCDGLILASPSYHGGMSGLIKNALDYLEELSGAPRPYLDGRAVGLIAVGAGWQGPNATLATMRIAVHALRGWPTPLGVTLNSDPSSMRAGAPSAPAQLQVVGHQVARFAHAQLALAAAAPTASPR